MRLSGDVVRDDGEDGVGGRLLEVPQDGEIA